jgi:RIO kinase 1
VTYEPRTAATDDEARRDVRRYRRALSPYNLSWWRGRAWIIDLPQAVDLVVNPNGFDLLHRDVTNLATWFGRRGLVCDPEATFAALLAEAW